MHIVHRHFNIMSDVYDASALGQMYLFCLQTMYKDQIVF